MQCVFCGSDKNKIMHIGERKNPAFNNEIVAVCDKCYTNHMSTLKHYILF